ncbi:ribonuclease CAF1 [Colletotrichum zoysiae]|uniref:Ribonuclease CAF1 n=1 Tax=Colletotrichum zoysiae TaxID=1216348 RepID=A0AAD9HPZ7_9PEZI|nr:ribonuclease CAF1 [Colletotrichum zoysiae]
MEVTTENFWQKLPRVLLSIANSQFVAIDLEMTGIADKASVEKCEYPDRQQVYKDAKMIASTFNVFDLGITCIIAQPDGSYEVESYSFPVSPYLQADTRDDEMFVRDVDRRLCVAYDTLRFLRKEGVQMEKMYQDCVPYLSRKDVRMATERMEKRMEPRKEKEHPYSESDEGLLFFSTYVWDTINDWLLESVMERSTEIKILVPPSDSKKRTSIYHKIVRREAQDLVPDMRCRIWNYGATVIIYPADDEKDNELTALRCASPFEIGFRPRSADAETFCEKARQMFQSTSPTDSEDASEDEHDDGDGPGVRLTPQSTGDRTRQNFDTSNDWSAGSGWSPVPAPSSAAAASPPTHPPTPTATSPPGSNGWGEVFTGTKEPSAESLAYKVAQAFQLVEDKLKVSPPVIVGHNQFMDLLFLYNTFIDDLPDTLDDFLAEIHELFPLIIDTKLLAIEDQAIEGEDPLQDLYNRLNDRKAMPQITCNTAYGHGRGGKAHDAGFDSFMTATVFLRLAYKLACKNLPGDDDEEAGRKLRSLYSREWLSAIGRDPDEFEDQRSSSPCWSEPSEPSDADNEGVSQPDWEDPVFDLARNTIRIAPHKTIYIGDEAWTNQLRMSGWRKLLRISQKGRVKRKTRRM